MGGWVWYYVCMHAACARHGCACTHTTSQTHPHILACAAQVAQAKASNFAWTPPTRPEAAPKQAAPLVPTHPPPLAVVSFAGLGGAPRPHESRAARRLEVHARSLCVCPMLVHMRFSVSSGVSHGANAAVAMSVDDLNSCLAPPLSDDEPHKTSASGAAPCNLTALCSGYGRGAGRQVGPTCAGSASVGPSTRRAVEQSLSATCLPRFERSARREHARC